MTRYEAVLDLLSGPNELAQVIQQVLTFELADQFSLATAERITKSYIPGEYKFIKWHFPPDRRAVFEVIAEFPSQQAYLELKLTWF